jgi:HSP20 family protein
MISFFKKKVSEEKDLPATEVAAETEVWSLEAADEGELMLDVIDAPDKLIVRSTIAGADIGDIEVHVHNDLLTIRGKREDDLPDDSVFLYRECYFGPFSRSVILPHPVREVAIEATLKNGVLTIILPKKEIDTAVKIKKE